MAYDGAQGVVASPQHLAEFLTAHQALEFIFHGAALQLASMQRALDQYSPGVFDIYRLVDERRVWDVELLHRLHTLATTGDVAAIPESTLKHCVDLHLWDSKLCEASVVPCDLGPTDAFDLLSLARSAESAIAAYAVFKTLHRGLCLQLRGTYGALGHVSPDWLLEMIGRWGPQTHHIQLRATIVLRGITATGLRVDVARASALLQSATAECEPHRAVLVEHGYVPGQKGNSCVLQRILEGVNERHGGSVFDRTPKGQLRTDRDSLSPLRQVEPFVDAYLGFKRLQTRLTYLQKMQRPELHPEFEPLLVTGRTSSSGEINAQSLPRDAAMRRCFCPREGHVFIDADYSTIELRALAQAVMSQFHLRSYMADALNRGDDLHRLLAARVTGKSPDQVTEEERRCAKAINFGKPGGMGSKTLQQYANTNYGLGLDLDQVRGLEAAWFAEFPEMRTFLSDEPLSIHRDEWGATFADTRYDDDLRGAFTLTGRLRAMAGYAARHNLIFQGLAADGAKLSLWKLWRAGYRLVNFVHDEVLIEVPAAGDIAGHQRTVERLMVEGMREILTDVRVDVASAALSTWCKEDRLAA